MDIVSFEKFELQEEDIQGGVLGSDMTSGPRSDGLHWSHIVRHITRPRPKNGEPSPTSWYREAGFMWEMMLDQVFKQRMRHHRRQRINQLRFENDDIHMSPDGLVFDGPPPGPQAMSVVDLFPVVDPKTGAKVWQHLVKENEVWKPTGKLIAPEDYIEEYKATWRSMRKVGSAPTYDDFKDEFWSWHMQVMGYCRAAQVTRADFYILFMNGDYKPMVPDAVYISVRYSERELEENWEMGLNHKEEVLALGSHRT